jgi:hypothetical protein
MIRSYRIQVYRNQSDRIPQVTASPVPKTAREPLMTTIRHWSTNVAGFKAFCSKAGSVDAPALLLFHGFSSAGPTFRKFALFLQPSSRRS